MNIIEKCLQAINDLRKNHDLSSTYIIPLDYIDGNRWALVFAFQDGYEPKYSEDGKGNSVCGKVAYQPRNYIMQEYDIDWLMPYDNDNNEVDDTETTIGISDIKDSVNYLLEEWNRIKNSKILKAA